MPRSRSYFWLALSVGIAATSFAVKAADGATSSLAWPLLALALIVPLATPFRDTWAYRSLIDAFYRLAAVVRRTVSAERVREHAWLNPA